MKTEEVMAKIRWALGEAAKGNTDALDQIHDPDIVYHLYPFPDIEAFEYDDWLGFLQQLGVVPLIGPK